MKNENSSATVAQPNGTKKPSKRSRPAASSKDSKSPDLDINEIFPPIDNDLERWQAQRTALLKDTDV